MYLILFLIFEELEIVIILAMFNNLLGLINSYIMLIKLELISPKVFLLVKLNVYGVNVVHSRVRSKIFLHS